MTRSPAIAQLDWPYASVWRPANVNESSV